MYFINVFHAFVLKIFILIVYHTQDYNEDKKNCNHFVEYLNESGKIIEKIKKIFAIQNSLFWVIEKCLKKTIIFNDLDNLINHINRFFCISGKNWRNWGCFNWKNNSKMYFHHNWLRRICDILSWYWWARLKKIILFNFHNK